MKDFRKLQVWEKSHNLVLDIYKVTTSFPSSELYGLTSQLRRAAASIPSNIAEGVGRVVVMRICAACCKLPLGQQAKWNTSYFLHLS